jgi:hypothetical protein
MILGRHSFEHNGRVYHAELRIIGFSLNHNGDNPRWVVFNSSLDQHWTLPGEGMITETSSDVQIRFTEHLSRGGSRPRTSEDELIQ